MHYYLACLVVMSASALRVAVQGSGMASATVARLLSASHDVTVFEAGRGPGGRMSTRRAEAYQFDHGAQYFSPKTAEFAGAVREWRERGWVDVWDGRHRVWSAERGVAPDAPKDRFVGTPGMSAVCKGLLDGVRAVYGTRAVATRAGGRWRLTHGRSGAALGDFDFLVCGDKTAALAHRTDLPGELAGFAGPAAAAVSARSLVLLVATDPLGLDFESLRLEGHPSFAWLARDDSKPGRARSDGAECWVAQASPALTERLLESVRGGDRRRGKPNAIRRRIVADVAPLFADLVGDLGGDAPNVRLAQGHRWGAAFPLSPLDGDFYVDEARDFAACGDYFADLPARVEGAHLSGSRLAASLLAAWRD